MLPKNGKLGLILLATVTEIGKQQTRTISARNTKNKYPFCYQ